MENPIGSLPPLTEVLIGQLLFLFVLYLLARAPKKMLAQSPEARKMQRRLNIVFFIIAIVEIGLFFIVM